MALPAYDELAAVRASGPEAVERLREAAGVDQGGRRRLASPAALRAVV